MSEALDFDGERFTPESVREIWYEHMHRYAFASRLVGGLDVLDAACGEGYGAAILARQARSVTAVDRSVDAIAHAGQRYVMPNLEFREADCCALPFEADRFDCIVSFETIEHLADQEGMVSEFKRVLKPTGFLLISSPDKAEYSDAQGFDNPHHVRELYADEFADLLLGAFPHIRLLGQKLLFHSAIWPLQDVEESPGKGISTCLQNSDGEVPREHARPVQRPMYLLALCASSLDALPPTDHRLWLFDDAAESVYRHYQHEIRKNMQAGAILAERDAELARAREALSSAASHSPPRRSWLSKIGLFRRG
ncbi:MAG: class I SAM-dependent methyltransferase [Xanthomonadales bacterium]|nr:class I SAM-dependent methyltransferase [Xanthomonadales bacterium]